MKFPISYCIPTSILTQEMYCELICKLVTDGYINNVSNIQSITLAQMWDFLGVNRFGDIFLYDQPTCYTGIDEVFDNILDEQWLEGYLK